MKLNLTLLLLVLLLSSQSYTFNNSLKLFDSSKTITCVFYLDAKSELISNLDVTFYNLDENFTINSITDTLGIINLKNTKGGHNTLFCYVKGSIIVIDSVLLTSPKTEIRLYDYMFESQKEYIDRAKNDIRNKEIKILLGGFPLLKDESDKKKTFKKKYGIYFENAGCDPTDLWLYNYKIFNYLDSVYGKLWREEYEKIWESE